MTNAECSIPTARSLIESSRDTWQAYVQHEFFKQLAKGTLRKESFLRFHKQDYFYLRYYARAYAQLAANSSTFSSIRTATEKIIAAVDENTKHPAYCAQLGITEEELDTTPESPATTAYGAFVLDIGLQGRSVRIIHVNLCMALSHRRQRATGGGTGGVLAWVLGGGSLAEEGGRKSEQLGEAGREPVRKIDRRLLWTGLDTIEAIAVADPPSSWRFQEWHATWETCVRLEKDFWDMAMDLL